MSICTIFAMESLESKKYSVGYVQKRHEMNNWLLSKGDKKYTYELNKGGNIHSRWIWKEKNERWGRTATPSNNPPKENKMVAESSDRLNRKKLRQQKHRSKKDRPPRG